MLRAFECQRHTTVRIQLRQETVAARSQRDRTLLVQKLDQSSEFPGLQRKALTLHPPPLGDLGGRFVKRRAGDRASGTTLCKVWHERLGGWRQCGSQTNVSRLRCVHRWEIWAENSSSGATWPQPRRTGDRNLPNHTLQSVASSMVGAFERNGEFQIPQAHRKSARYPKASPDRITSECR
jgi:hypothetical protein